MKNPPTLFGKKLPPGLIMWDYVVCFLGYLWSLRELLVAPFEVVRYPKTILIVSKKRFQLLVRCLEKLKLNKVKFVSRSKRDPRSNRYSTWQRERPTTHLVISSSWTLSLITPKKKTIKLPTAYISPWVKSKHNLQFFRTDFKRNNSQQAVLNRLHCCHRLRGKRVPILSKYDHFNPKGEVNTNYLSKHSFFSSDGDGS